MLSNKAKNLQKKMGIFTMKSFSTASLPSATVTQTWNIEEATRSKMEIHKRGSSYTQLPPIQSPRNTLQIKIPTPKYA